mgnify:CR=1 FL=1
MFKQIKNQLENLSYDEMTNLLLIISKSLADEDPIKLKEVIAAALKNGIMEAETYKSLGYENMALSYGLAFIEIQNLMANRPVRNLMQDEIEESIMLFMKEEKDKVYH